MKTATVVPPGLAITDAGLISTAGKAVDPRIRPVPCPPAMVAPAAAERFTVKVLTNPLAGSGSTVTVTALLSGRRRTSALVGGMAPIVDPGTLGPAVGRGVIDDHGLAGGDRQADRERRGYVLAARRR